MVKEAEQVAFKATRAADKAAIKLMRRSGLTIHKITPKQAAKWRLLQQGFEPLVGPVGDERAFKIVNDALKKTTENNKLPFDEFLGRI